MAKPITNLLKKGEKFV
jgi:hypothetical protein